MPDPHLDPSQVAAPQAIGRSQSWIPAIKDRASSPRVRPYLLTAIFAAALAFPYLDGNEGDIDAVANAFAYAMLALGLNIVVGFAGLLDLCDGDFAQTDMADFASLLQALDGAERFFDGNLGVDAMKLPKVEALYFQAAEAHLDLLLEVFGAAYFGPSVWALTGKSSFCGDDYPLGIGAEGLAYQPFADLRPIGIRGIDEVDAEFHRTSQNAFAFFGVFGFTPDTIAGYAHRAITQPIYCEVAANCERPARLCIHFGRSSHAR